MGNDGSGKTTLAMAIASKMKDLGFDVEYHMCFKYLILGSLQKVLLRGGLNEIRKSFLERKEAERVFNVWSMAVFLDCVLAFLYFKLLKRNKTVIFDRYFYDFIMGFEYENNSNGVIRRLFLLLPKPDIGFILDVPPKVAFQRKKNIDSMDLNYYRNQREKYLELADKMSIRVINTKKSVKESVNEVIEVMKERI